MEINKDQMRAALDLANLAFDEGPVPCQSDPDAWFPEKSNDRLPGYSGLHGGINNVKKLCNEVCPIVLECRAYALKHHEIEGVWGGMSYLDRKIVWSKRGEVIPSSRKGIPNRRH